MKGYTIALYPLVCSGLKSDKSRNESSACNVNSYRNECQRGEDSSEKVEKGDNGEERRRVKRS